MWIRKKWIVQMDSKDRTDNRTNEYLMDRLIKHVNSYLRRGNYNTLQLEIVLQDGVIQVIRTSSIEEKKKIMQ